MNRRVLFALTLLTLGVSLSAQSQTPRQERIKSCHQQATEMNIEKNKWRAFMKSCIGAKAETAAKPAAPAEPAVKAES